MRGRQISCTTPSDLLQGHQRSGCGSVVECGLPKPEMRVRFPSPAPISNQRVKGRVLRNSLKRQGETAFIPWDTLSETTRSPKINWLPLSKMRSGIATPTRTIESACARFLRHLFPPPRTRKRSSFCLLCAFTCYRDREGQTRRRRDTDNHRLRGEAVLGLS